jgi:predicted RNA-binding Zn-ribbon protein involved in translation (DUF1610 family)
MTNAETCRSCEADLGRDDSYRCPECGLDLVRGGESA